MDGLAPEPDKGMATAAVAVLIVTAPVTLPVFVGLYWTTTVVDWFGDSVMPPPLVLNPAPLAPTG